jgi:hypothetical protein
MVVQVSAKSQFQIEEPCNSLINIVKSYVLIAFLIYWLDSLISGGGLPLVNLPLICNPNFNFMGGVGEKVSN